MHTYTLCRSKDTYRKALAHAVQLFIALGQVHLHTCQLLTTCVCTGLEVGYMTMMSIYYRCESRQ